MAIAERSLEVAMYSLSHAIAQAESQRRRELARSARPRHEVAEAQGRPSLSLRARFGGAIALLVPRPARTSLVDR